MSAPEDERFHGCSGKELGNRAVRAVEIVTRDVAIELVLVDFDYRCGKRIDAVSVSAENPTNAVKGARGIRPGERTDQSSVTKGQLEPSGA